MAKIFVDSGSCIVWIEKTGQVLVRTCSTERHPAVRKKMCAPTRHSVCRAKLDSTKNALA
jgi:hypothetical protein